MKNIKHILTVISLLIGLAGAGITLYKEWQIVQRQNQVLGTADSRGFEQAIVSKVIDGDTIELSDGRTVRYIGIDTPETKHPTKGQECFGTQASQRNTQLVQGQTIQLEKDVSETDRYGRLLRYVWLNDIMINQQLVGEGYAFASSYPPDIKHQTLLDVAETRARNSNQGLWASCPLNDVPAINDVINQIDEQINNATPSADVPVSDGCVIKGNISSNGKLYHLPRCSSYSQVEIDESKGEQWFCGEDEAKAAGWSLSGSC